jgi:Uma2 family endonuclease
MSAVLTPLIAPPPIRIPLRMRRFTVNEYHRMIEAGILTEADNVELLEGYLVEKDMVRTPQHDGPMDLFEGAIADLIPPGWFLRIQRAITLVTSEPEPDYAIVRGTRRDHLQRHPGPAEVGLLVEVSYSSLANNLTDKVRIYWEAGIPLYWVIDTVNKRLIAYSGPGFSNRAEHPIGSSAPLVLGGRTVGHLAVADVMP